MNWDYYIQQMWMDLLVAASLVAPLVLVFLLLRQRMMWIPRQVVRRVFDERKLLIDKGVTDLPPLALPETPEPSDLLRLGGFTNLKAGIILLFLGAGISVGIAVAQTTYARLSLPYPIVLAALGLGFVVVHFAIDRPLHRERLRQIESLRQQDANLS